MKSKLIFLVLMMLPSFAFGMISLDNYLQDLERTIQSLGIPGLTIQVNRSVNKPYMNDIFSTGEPAEYFERLFIDIEGFPFSISVVRAQRRFGAPFKRMGLFLGSFKSTDSDVTQRTFNTFSKRIQKAYEQRSDQDDAKLKLLSPSDDTLILQSLIFNETDELTKSFPDFLKSILKELSVVINHELAHKKSSAKSCKALLN